MFLPREALWRATLPRPILMRMLITIPTRYFRHTQQFMKTIETDILIVGSGITAALMAERLPETTPRKITVVEAGRRSTPFAERGKARDRYIAYGESPWKNDHLDDQNAFGTTWGDSPSVTVGGLAMPPNGLANRSDNVGRWLAGHRNVNAHISLPGTLYPGINVQHSLASKQFMRPGAQSRYLRQDLRIWESTVAREPRWRDDNGDLQLGDALLADWRAKANGATARVRAYYDVIPDRESRLVLDDTHVNRFGDPMPHLTFRDARESASLRVWQEEQIRELFRTMAKAGNGTIARMENSSNDLGQEHPGGGCRLGTNAATSVADAWGRTHDHENLWIAGAPAHVSTSCCNGTLTFVAVGLRTAAAIARG